MNTPQRTEFSQALRALANERGLDAETIIETIKQAIIAAYKRDAKDLGVEVDNFEYDAEINPVNGEAKVFAWPLEKPEERKDITPPGFGRIAAQTAKQVIHQKIREAEKGAIMSDFTGKVGNLISGIILRFEGSDVRVDLGRTEGIMLSEERIPTERLNLTQRMTFLLKDIIETPRGKQIILSRADSNFVRKLFEREVPEMSSGSVVVKAIAREAGVRTKIAVFSSQPGVDPVGSCVGQKGVRVQTITNELGGERVDVIAWNEDAAELVKAALSPAENLIVKIDKKKNIAVVSAPEDQLSLAIGRDGQNARLTAKLTNMKIEIKEIKGDKVKDTKVEKQEEGKGLSLTKASEGKETEEQKVEGVQVQVQEKTEAPKNKATEKRIDEITKTDFTENEETKTESTKVEDTKSDKKEK